MRTGALPAPDTEDVAPVIVSNPVASFLSSGSTASIGVEAASADPAAAASVHAAAGQVPKALSQICDLIALTSALITTMTSGPLLSFDYDAIARADERWVNTTLGTAKALPENATPVSTGLALYSTYLLSIGAFSLFSSIIGRCVLCFYESCETASEQHELVLSVAPLIALAAVSLIVTIVMLPFPLYFAGWVVFKAQIVDVPSYYWAGAWLIMAVSLLLVYFAFIVVYHMRYRGANLFQRGAKSAKDASMVLLKKATVVISAAKRGPKYGSPIVKSSPVR